jgi:hypothetical protein
MIDLIGRGERIRTSDLTVPNRALYQAEPRPDKEMILGERWRCVKLIANRLSTTCLRKTAPQVALAPHLQSSRTLGILSDLGPVLAQVFDVAPDPPDC